LRQIVLDTETTGLYAKNGDRIVEVGCVELVDRKPTGRRLHRYLNPERDVPMEAQRIHGLTDEFLADKPKFREVAAELADFIRDAELVIHNASFDMEFLNVEFGLLGIADMESARSLCAGVVDTRCATNMASTIPIASSTAPCSMRNCWRKSIWQ
jgi:DNA polymerase-3 subunit epsilon